MSVICHSPHLLPLVPGGADIRILFYCINIYINITYSVSIYIYNIYNIFNIFKVVVLCKRATILSHLSNSE